MDICPFLGSLVPLFWISGDVSSGFQSQSGFCLIRYSCGGECNVHSPRFTSGATLADLLVVGAWMFLQSADYSFHVNFVSQYSCTMGVVVIEIFVPVGDVLHSWLISVSPRNSLGFAQYYLSHLNGGVGHRKLFLLSRRLAIVPMYVNLATFTVKKC